MSAARRLVLLDRDGTINFEKHYLSTPEQLELLPQASEGIQLIGQMGFSTAVVTNQSAIGRGYFGYEMLDLIHKRLLAMLLDRGARLDAIYVCPHRPENGCECRKPGSGLALRAAEDFGAELTESFVIGDNVCDIEMGKRIGATTILVCTGYGAEIVKQGSIDPDYVVGNLLEAAQMIRLVSSAQRSFECT